MNLKGRKIKDIKKEFPGPFGEMLEEMLNRTKIQLKSESRRKKKNGASN